MIIKCIPIKSKTRLENLIGYITSDKGKIVDYTQHSIFHNMKNRSLEGIFEELEANHEQYSPKRSGHNIAMSGFISFHPKDRDVIDNEIMDDVTMKFLQTAYPDTLGFATTHTSDNRHAHFIVSGNNFMSKTSTRLSNQRLLEVHKIMQEYTKQKIPGLTVSLDLSRWGKRLHSEKSYHMKKRNPDLQLTKEKLQEKVQDIFRYSKSSEQFYSLLQFEGFTTYQFRDLVQGIVFGDDGKKIRFSRLGIEQKQLAELDRQYTRLNELDNLGLDYYATESMLEDFIERKSIEEFKRENPRAFELSVPLDHYALEELRESYLSPTPVDIYFDDKTVAENEMSEVEHFKNIINLPIDKVIMEADIDEYTPQESEQMEVKSDEKSLTDLRELENYAEKFIQQDLDEIREMQRLDELGVFDDPYSQSLLNGIDLNSIPEFNARDTPTDFQENFPDYEPSENDLNELNADKENEISDDRDMDL